MISGPGIEIIEQGVSDGSDLEDINEWVENNPDDVIDFYYEHRTDEQAAEADGIDSGVPDHENHKRALWIVAQLPDAIPTVDLRKKALDDFEEFAQQTAYKDYMQDPYYRIFAGNGEGSI